MKWFPRLFGLSLFPHKLSLTARTAHLNADTTSVGWIAGIKLKSFSALGAEWRFSNSRGTKILSDDLVLISIRIFRHKQTIGRQLYR